MIKAHADRRFRSEYDYALFEYYRSAKVIALLDRAGVTLHGRALDCGCGGGGMPMSLAEHVHASIGIDPFNRFGDAVVSGFGIANATQTATQMPASLPASAVVLIETVPSGLGTSEMCRRSSASSSGAIVRVWICSAVPS